MEFKDREINQQYPPYIPPIYRYFTEQAGSRGPIPDMGQIEQLFWVHRYPHYHPCPVGHPHYRHESILREIEKEKIRQEIIMYEISRRRILEAEVRRELMVERELAPQGSGDGFPFRPSPPNPNKFVSPKRLTNLGARDNESSLEEKSTISGDETKEPNGRRESGGFETLPLKERTADLKISEVKPAAEEGKEKQKADILGKPDKNLSGLKRKTVTPPVVDTSEVPSSGIVKKKPKQEWKCDICQVNGTSERVLNDHLQGKKHKLKEAALMGGKSGKNYSIGLFPKNASKTVDASKVNFTDVPLLFKKEPEKDNDNPIPDNTKSDKSVSVQKVQKNGDPKNKMKYPFWCEMCKVGAHSPKIMSAHEKGKKHVKRLRISDQTAIGNNADETMNK